MSSFVSHFYFSTRGRISRKFYWLFGCVPFLVAGAVLGGVLVIARPNLASFLPVILLFIVAGVWIAAAIYAKRLHDIGLSAWWLVLALLVYLLIALFVSLPASRLLSFVLWVVIGVIPGAKGANRYGPDPTRSRGEQLERSDMPAA